MFFLPLLAFFGDLAVHTFLRAAPHTRLGLTDCHEEPVFLGSVARHWSRAHPLMHGSQARPFLALDEDQPMTPGEVTQLDVPLGPTVWLIEQAHSIVARISTHPPDDQCLAVIMPPVGCSPTERMVESLRGGADMLRRGGATNSLINLPLLERGKFSPLRNVASPTGTSEYPLPVVW